MPLTVEGWSWGRGAHSLPTPCFSGLGGGLGAKEGFPEGPPCLGPREVLGLEAAVGPGRASGWGCWAAGGAWRVCSRWRVEAASEAVTLWPHGRLRGLPFSRRPPGSPGGAATFTDESPGRAWGHVCVPTRHSRTRAGNPLAKPWAPAFAPGCPAVCPLVSHQTCCFRCLIRNW